jgi:hypothetical protein
MKKTLLALIVLAALALILSWAIPYFQKPVQAPVTTGTGSTTSFSFTNNQILQALGIIDEPTARIDSLNKVDLNNDGYEDAVVRATTCGASCSHKAYVLLNQSNGVKSLGSLNPKVDIEVDPRNIHNVQIDAGVITIEFSNLAAQVTHVGKYKIEGEKIVALQ